MSFRNRPTLDRRHRPRWQDELRSQQLIVGGFAVAIAIALGIFGATAWSSYYDNHLKEVAYVGNQSFDVDALNLREGIIYSELSAKQLDLSIAAVGVQNSLVQQQLQVVQQTQQNIVPNAADSLTTGAYMRDKAPSLGISVSSSAIDQEIAKRTTLPFRIELSIITVNALPSDAAAGATPTDAQWATAKQTAQDLLDQVKKGTDFATLAKDKSDDAATKDQSGLIGWVEEGDASYGQFFDAAKSSAKGDLLGPIKGDTAYAILKVDDVRKATPDTTLQRLLASVHASDADYRAYITDELLKTAFTDYFGTHVVSNYMPQRHVAQIQIQPDTGVPLPKERVRHIMIQPIPGAQDQSTATQAQWDAALATAQKVHDLVTQPNADWMALAKEYSDDPGSRDYGGDLGWYDPTTTTQIDADFKAALDKLHINQISEPVKTQFGYHIIEVFEQRTTAQEQADKVESELKADPSSWDKVTAAESADHATAYTGGDIGWVAPYEKDIPLETAIFGLKNVGDISAPVSTTGGIYIFKLIEKSAARWIDDSRLSSIKSVGYPRWRDQIKADVGTWLDTQYQSTTSATG
jgi:parvulin-like peptidyl-prolyl isomerase